jgi:hypothetical protein
VLGISLQMNIAPRSAVIPPGTLVNVGMFAATKCRENRILRLVRSPPPGLRGAVDCPLEWSGRPTPEGLPRGIPRSVKCSKTWRRRI